MSSSIAEPAGALAPATEEPEQALERFTAALASGDSAAAAACFAPEGCLLTPDGTAVAGRQQIREVLLQITTARTQVRYEQARVVRAGPIALCSQRWSLASRGVGEGAFERRFAATMVLAEAAGPGRWALLIASPWGEGRG